MDATQATVLAAVATTASAVVIAWQAWETRRTAAATEKTLVVGQESLSTSKALAVEALRTRLDARGQALRVHVAPPAWPPLQPSDFGDAQPLPHGHTYRMSRDRDEQLVLRAELEIRNEGNRDATLVLIPPLRPQGESGPYPPHGYQRVVPRGGRLQATLEEARPISQWVQNWDDAQAGRPPSVVIVAEIVCSDGFDEGVIDRWRIELTGRPIRPIDGDDSGWALNHQLDAAPRPISATVPPQERLYYLSKRADQRV
jgi:hypothetical protein